MQDEHNLARDEHGRRCERWQVGPIAAVSADLQTEPGRARRTWRHRLLRRRVIAAAAACAGYATTRTAHELHAESASHGPADSNVTSAESISHRWFSAARTYWRAQWREGRHIAAAARRECGRADAARAAAASWRAPNSAPHGESGAEQLARRKPPRPGRQSKRKDGLCEARGAEGDCSV